MGHRFFHSGLCTISKWQEWSIIIFSEVWSFQDITIHYFLFAYDCSLPSNKPWPHLMAILLLIFYCIYNLCAWYVLHDWFIYQHSLIFFGQNNRCFILPTYALAMCFVFGVWFFFFFFFFSTIFFSIKIFDLANNSFST